MAATDIREIVSSYFSGDVSDGSFVHGRPVATSGGALQVEDPATTKLIATVNEATDLEVDAAVTSAQQAFETVWRDTRGPARASLLYAIAQAIRVDQDNLALLECLDTGKPLRQAKGDIWVTARYFEYYAGMADKLHGEMIPGEQNYWAYTLREPYGVVAHITPWNSPVSQMCRAVAPCLAAGNTVVVKPSEITPLSTLAIAQLLTRAGLPDGVVNIVTGRGPTTGAALVRHPDVAHVTFTGSVATGKAILSMAAERVVGCNLELGGKSPTIVMPDANFDAAVEAGANAVIRNAGQSCHATTRLIVHESLVEEYSDAVAKAVANLSVGPGLEDKDLGPLASRQQLNKVLGAIATAQAEGATLATGGTGIDEWDGHFVLPAVLTNVDNHMTVAQEEVFGPVQTVLSFHDEDEAVAIANDSIYGLSAGVFSTNGATAHRIARRLQAGTVQINRYPMGIVETPFGGYKQSGIGREKGLAALEHYTQSKTVIVAD